MKNKYQHLYQAADAAGMSSKTARKYLQSGVLPSQCRHFHDWATYPDAFAKDWSWIEDFLKTNSGLEAKYLFEALQRRCPGKYQDGQLRTFQRRVKVWRALYGPGQEVYFPQIYKPGQWCESDFTRMNKLGITICGSPFPHMLYHFVMCLSNWETVTICFSESYESLSAGLQNALWKLGGIPRYHKTDNLTCAVNKVGSPEEFTDNYKGLARHYGFTSCKIQPACPNENGDIEQRHHRLKRVIEQALILRGSRDFNSRQDYEKFLEKLLDQLNAGRKERLAEELKALRPLPARRHEDFTRNKCRVSRFSTIRVLKNSYSLHSRLIGEQVDVRIYADHLEAWYAQRRIEILPRLRGENGHYINYRHVIDTLVRKPGAFENYRYKDDMFPTSQFRIAYDILRHQHGPKQANKHYLKILELAAKENQTAVNEALRFLINHADIIDFATVNQMVESEQQPPAITDVFIGEIDIDGYDCLLEYREALLV
ncbi:MAG: IS21 family transposase [bacterium]